MCLDYIMIYYINNNKEKNNRIILKKDFINFRSYFCRSSAYTKEDKRFSKFVVVHPYMYYCAQRIYWKLILLLKGKKSQ